MPHVRIVVVQMHIPRLSPSNGVGFAAMWVVALVGASILRFADDADFERFLGGVHPVVAVSAAGAVGFISLRRLDRVGWVGRGGREGLGRSTIGAVAFAAAILVADSALGFPESINIPWPTSVAFYPVMGFIAESLFHLAPLAASAALVERFAPKSGVLASAVPVALIEALYQVPGSSDGGTSNWLLGYLVVHMTAFGLFSLATLRRSGFAAMMWFRLVYYLIWHVVWGAVRLELLF